MSTSSSARSADLQISTALQSATRLVRGSFHVLRSYGRYAHNRRQDRERCRELLGGQPLPLNDDKLDGEIPEGERPLGPPEEFCKVCGFELVVLEVIPRTARPPPEKLYGRPA